jgi:RNA polymerase sigma factor (sigma-70 family)
MKHFALALYYYGVTREEAGFMGIGQLGTLLRHLRGRGSDAGREAPDGQLLERFVAERDESAFAALAQRHGPLVWGVCCRVLDHAQDAEDAFQATFLVLARKAGSIARHDSVRSWLYGVAHRVAVRARANRSRRRSRECRLEPQTAADSRREDGTKELLPILDEEIGRLAEKYRLAIILCCLEGKTDAEAARQLGCPRATVATRLARAREQLRRRMTRRGLAVPAATFAAVLSPAAAPAAPAALAQSVTRAAVVLAAGQALSPGLIPAEVLTLTKEVCNAMFVSKLKLLVVLFAVVVLATGLGVASSQPPPTDPVPKERPPAPPEVVKPAAPAPDTRPALLKEKVSIAESGFRVVWERYTAGKSIEEEVYNWSKRWLDAEREASTTKAGQIAALEAHLGRIQELEKLIKLKHEVGRATVVDMTLAQFARVEAELWLAEARTAK